MGKTQFCSGGFMGCHDDDDTIKTSDFLKYVEPNDLYLVDKGYESSLSAFALLGAVALMPPKKGSTRLSKEQTEQGRKVSKHRIHIERLNARIKNYRYVMDESLSLPIREMVVFSLAFMSNYRTPLTFRDSSEGDEE